MINRFILILVTIVLCTTTFAQNIRLNGNNDTKGYYNAEKPVTISIGNLSSGTYILKYKFKWQKDWHKLQYYEGSIVPNSELEIQYVDLLLDTTDIGCAYINRLAKDVYFKLNDGDEVSAKFLVKPKFAYILYRTTDNTDLSFHIRIIPENFRDLDWSEIFELNCTPINENEVAANGENFELRKNGDVYEVQIKNTENNFSINGTLKIECQIQAKNETSISQEINPNSFTINQSDIPATPNAASISYNPPTAPTLLMVVVV